MKPIDRWLRSVATLTALMCTLLWGYLHFAQGAAPPALDMLLPVVWGSWIVAAVISSRTPTEPIEPSVDDPMLVTRKLRDLTLQQHGLAPTPTPTLPTCPDAITDADRISGTNVGDIHRCTRFEGHTDLHEHLPMFWNGPPQHRWYRLSDGSVIGW